MATLTKRRRKACGATGLQVRVALNDVGLLVRCPSINKMRLHNCHQQLVLLTGALRGVHGLIAHACSMQLPVIVDPKGIDAEPYRGATLLTPNLNEFDAVVGHCKIEAELLERARHMRSQFDLHALLVTRNEQGMSQFIENRPPIRLPTHAREVFDVTGAGDSVTGVIGTGLAAAVVLANNATGIVVAKMGTDSAGGEELHGALYE